MTETAKLAALLRADQCVRWRRGEPITVESYLERHPQLRADRDALLDLVYNEMVLRQECGQPPQLAEYLERFGEMDGQLRLLFEVHEALEQAPATESDAAGDSQPADGLVPPSPAGASLPAVPGYTIEGELGRGGMGVVFKARQLSLNRLVALKMILSGPHADATERARFRTEAEAVARLSHPNIVQVFEVGETSGQLFLALEYVEGTSLEGLTATPQPAREAAALVEQVARAVHHAHQRGILHRDLKPANVLLAACGLAGEEGAAKPQAARQAARQGAELVPKITDFGLAKVLADGADGPTPTEAFLGTPSYASPEQAAGRTRDVGVPADVYSLGAILYHLLTGRPPFKGTSLLHTLEQVRTLDPVPPARVCSGVPRDLETVCLKCLEKDPTRRYDSAQALADDLERFLQGRPVLARRAPAWERLWRGARRRPARAALAVAVVALVGLAGTFAWHLRVSAGHRAEQRYQQFVHHRDEAFFYGLLTPDQGALLPGAARTASAWAAEAAAQEALALAGLGEADEPAALASPFRAHPHGRRIQDEVRADCSTLLLVLAEARCPSGSADPPAAQQCRAALRLLDRARRLGLSSRAYHLRRSELLEQLGEKEQARKEREQADSLAPQSALDHFLAGQECYRRGAWTEAVGAFNRCLTLQPGHFWAQLFLAVCHLKLQQWEAARSGLNACLAQQPGFVWGYLFRSFANERLKATTQAEEDFRKALELDPNEDARYTLHLMRGILRYHQNELGQAEADFAEARNLKPEQHLAHVNLAWVYLAQGDFARAEQQAERLHQLGAPDEVLLGYHVQRGQRLYQAGRYEEALQDGLAALRLVPEHPLPQRLCAQALLRLGRYEEAELAFGLYLRRGGEGALDIFRGRGLARMKLGRYPEVVDDYTRVLERAPDAAIYQHRGWAHFFCDAWKLALRDFDRAIELDPRQGDAYTGRGLARVMLGSYREGARDAVTALRLEPDSPEMMHNVACIFALASARADADRQQRDRQVLAADYRRQAVKALRQTLLMLRPEQRRPFWQDKVLPDEALAPIRGEAGFKKVEEEFFGAAGTPGP